MYERPKQDARPQEGQWESRLEQRLKTYYGPPLREHLLAQSTWQNLRSKLGQQQRPAKQVDWKHLFRRSKREPVPEYVRAAFMGVVYEARVAHPLPVLWCSFKKRVEPAVYSVPGLRPFLHLVLPEEARDGIDEAVLDTLLATGLARYRLTLQWPAPILHVLCFCPALASLLFLMFCRGLYLLLAMVLTVLLFLLSWMLWRWLRRNICLSGDVLAVQWLGRGPICQGLHGLADYQRMLAIPLARNRRRKWGVPSLAERIERICGTGIAMENEHLTLVR